METEVTTIRIVPPKEMFSSEALSPIPTHETSSNQLTSPVYHVHTPDEGGVLTYHVGEKYPTKSWPFKEAVYAIDTIKRLLVNIAKLLASQPMRYFAALFVLLPRSWKAQVLRRAAVEFADYTVIVFDRWGKIMQFEENGVQFGLQGVVWKPRYYCDMVREIRRVCLEMIGDDKPLQQVLEAACMVFEFDDAYRYFFQDLFGEVNREAMLTSPGKEMARLFQIAAERGPGASDKFNAFAKLIPFLFWNRDVKRAVRTFFKNVDLAKLRLDEADWYRTLLWGGWKFGGVPDDQRASTRMMIDAQWMREGQSDPAYALIQRAKSIQTN